MSCRQLSWTLTCLWKACLILLLATICKAKDNKLYIAGFFPTSQDLIQGSIGRGVLPAVHLALQHINNSPAMYRGYQLDLVWNNTKVKIITSVPLLIAYNMQMLNNFVQKL